MYIYVYIYIYIDLFQVTRKLRKNIRYRHIGRQRSRMPTTCAVVKCYNRHRKGSRISFYRFPKDPDRRRQWVAFVSRRNLDGSPWEPGEGDRICSQHFVTERKYETPSDPDYVPSVYPQSNGSISSVARFQRAQRRRIVASERQMLQEKEAEFERLYLSHIQKAFYHDHGSLFKHSTESEIERPTRLESSCIPSSSESPFLAEENIPVEVGEHFKAIIIKLIYLLE